MTGNSKTGSALWKWGLLAIVLVTVTFLWPRPGPALATGFSAVGVAAGEAHTCAVTTEGGVKCWGENLNGELGDGTIGGDPPSSFRSIPVDVLSEPGGLPFSGVAAIAAGDHHTCALMQVTGRVKCWGDNNFGQLGDGTQTDRTTPVDVCAGGTQGCAKTLSDVAAISTGGDHTCVLTEEQVLGEGSGVKCWGWNEWGQLGDGTSGDGDGNTADNIGTTPVDVCATGASAPCGSNLLSGVATVAARGGRIFLSGHTCALATAGQVKCWGRNLFKQLGDGTTTDRTTPVDVCATDAMAPCSSANNNILTGVAALAVGARNTCSLEEEQVLGEGGGVKCWGRGNALGNGTCCVASNIPVDVCATDVIVPPECTAANNNILSGVAAVAAGWDHICARMTAAATVKCWGTGKFAQLGDGTIEDRTTPVDVCAGGLQACTKPLSGVAVVAGGREHTCAVTAGGGVKCWGRNAQGYLGDGTTDVRKTPVDVVGSKPKSVGGISVDLGLAGLPLEAGDSSGPGAGVLAGIAAGVAVSIVALGGAAWYARRRANGR